jgi:uncharacterized protein
MLRIHIGSITEKGLNLNQREDAAGLPLLSAVASDGAVSFTRPIRVRVHATRSGDAIMIDGTAGSEVRLQCSRCLEPFDMNIETDFSSTAVSEIASTIDPETVNEIELAADDIDVIAYSGDTIDLGDEIAQQIIMALPFKPLCRDACKGLCNRCGANLNNTSCQCRPQDSSSPFAVLKARTFPKEQG